MEKYLFIDGSNGIKELQSTDELESCIRAVSDTSAIRIWPFGGKEWLTLSQFRQVHQPSIPQRPAASKVQPLTKPNKPGKFRWIAPTLFAAGCIIVATLIYNFTRVKWSDASPVLVKSYAPANNPSINVDSVIQVVELSRGQKLDRITRTNLRIRNTWPERIFLTLRAERKTNADIQRFFNRSVTLDNATGYFIASADVRVDTWLGGNITSTDTLHLKAIEYTDPVSMDLAGQSEGDSISVSFITIQAPVFNFCYSADKQTNYGNYNDRWFCKD